MRHTVGERVFAMLSATETEVRLLGFGRYEGDEVPDEKADGMAALAREIKRPNPKIVLDGGKVVWGGECWWGPEERFAEISKGRSIVSTPR